MSSPMWGQGGFSTVAYATGYRNSVMTTAMILQNLLTSLNGVSILLAWQSETNLSPHLYYFKAKLNIPFSYQIVKDADVDSFINGVRLVSADRFLAGLI